ncbi:hypothetical protein BU25DRAFT_422243 [Macroventuria anomochaeta]|uniref:Uncharacterized protein n=1 Tax=Macroventuria anomochaeta TaxID=301207 RepID=A0ACB6RY05_9PLEO|nr:uncharacterized protein BU25DRAFT_422243 [Macroventuria anomochaeta]KAF2626915.1 hypothetical protein BU25DRAFT_422243 [Macroventuria anomochaeta]
MKYALTLELHFLVALVNAKVVPGRNPSIHRQDLAFHLNDGQNAGTAPVFSSNSTVIIAADKWSDAVDRGTKLLDGMPSNDATAATLYGFTTGTAVSPLDGGLAEKLRGWGYNDNTAT